MKSLTVIAMFALALLSLGMAMRVQADVSGDDVHIERRSGQASTDAGAVKPGPQRGRPGEDDTDEEDEEDLRAPSPGGPARPAPRPSR